MIQTDRLTSEREFHDRQAAERARHFAVVRSELIFPDSAYLDHETWIRPAVNRLGSLGGKRILDFGCGHGMAATVFARNGADVTAFDLSPGYVREAKERAQANGVHARFLVADGEQLPFMDGSFDAVWGSAILHHLDLALAGRELFRVLKPGGVAVFCEPWDGNPLLRFARSYLPYPGKHRTRDEQPLTSAMLVPLREIFPDLIVEPHQLLGMVGRVWKSRFLASRLARMDRVLFRTVPGLAKWSRYVVVALRKPAC
ncbi:MAG: class I SAM-dependent methyltransferase [Gemmataceae bacterium]